MICGQSSNLARFESGNIYRPHGPKLGSGQCNQLTGGQSTGLCCRQRNHLCRRKTCLNLVCRQRSDLIRFEGGDVHRLKGTKLGRGQCNQLPGGQRTCLRGRQGNQLCCIKSSLNLIRGQGCNLARFESGNIHSFHHTHLGGCQGNHLSSCQRGNLPRCQGNDLIGGEASLNLCRRKAVGKLIRGKGFDLQRRESCNLNHAESGNLAQRQTVGDLIR